MFGATTRLKKHVMPALVLLAACFALLGPEWIERVAADTDCHEASCVACSCLNKDDSAAAGASETPQVEYTFAAARQTSIPTPRQSSTCAIELIRAPPTT